MPIDTNFNTSPYFDDFDVRNQYYGVQFKPSVSVQTRELNTLQTILRNQIEKFGDAIFQIGTIIEGCNFSFYPSYPYAKIKDLTVGGLNVTMANYLGLFTKNSANLQAIIINTTVGFETTPPDLNTLYLSYRNAGISGNTYAYSPGDVLTVFDSNTGIWAVTVNAAGQSFSNSDTTIFTSALAVNVTSGSFSNGDYITQPTTGANLQIISIDTSSLAGIGQVVLSLKPRSADLSNIQSNGAQWATANNDSIRNSTNTAAGQVMAVIGSGAQAQIVTDGIGRVSQVAMQQRGQGYTMLPTVTIRSPNNATGVAALSLVPRNYVTQLTVSNTAGAVGNGYAFGVSDGTIYQKGLFLRVDAQTIIVDKYDQVPNNVSVGFLSNEQVVDSNIDPNLLDNASGFPNYQAPGADRIKIVPTLTVQSANATSPNFLPIVSWSEGNPYRQNQSTSYSAIGDKMAQELYETEGDFVLSRFEVTSRSTYTRNNESTKVSLIVNPGSAYIKGQRVFNSTNYSVDIPKTTDTATSNNRYISLNYGNWVRIAECGGVFQFSTGDTVTFYDTAKTFISGGAVTTGNTAPVGTAIGTARIRSMVHELGIPGDAACTYRLYLFDIVMNQGVNFSDIKSIYYNNTYSGIADVVLQKSATTGANVAMLANTDYDYLLFESGATSTLKNATNITYNYRTIDQTLNFANTGLLTKSIAAVPSETFPYVNSLNSSQLQDLYVVPVGGPLIAAANATGSANAASTSNVINGNATTWITDFAAGDYIQLFQNSTVTSINRVVAVTNNTQMQLSANPTFTGNNLGVYRYFPTNAPIPFGLRSGLSANVSANLQVMTLNLGMNLQGSVTVNTAVGVNITRSNVSAATKSAARDQYVKICTSNNAGGTAGPWCLGVSDIFRLKRVFLSDSTVNTASTEVTTYFYIDHKQNEDWVDLGYLYIKPNSGLTIANGQYLLVQFDCFQASGTGFFNSVSYVGANAQTIAVNDATPLANLGASVSTWEVPECFGSRGQYFDLLQYFDFRPIAANSVSPTTNAASAPLNPVYTLSFGNTANPANDKKFPLPDSAMQYNMEQYMGRIDSVFLDKTGQISVVRGIPATNNAKFPKSPANSIKLVDVFIPPYPVLPAVVGGMQAEILTTRIANINYLARRQSVKTISIPSAPGTPYDTQPRRYTMADIGKLDRRIQALQYYESLSAMQTDMVNRVVPSSVDPHVTRFKFGIFVDDFSTMVSQDVTNPAYAASITQSNMTPPTVSWVVGYGDGESAVQPYMDFKIIGQPDATVPKPPPVVVVDPPKLPAPTTSANVWFLRTDHLTPSQSGQVSLTDSQYLTFANTSGTATFYFYVPQTTIAPTIAMIDPDNFFIYQGSTLIADAYDNAVSLTSTDVAYLQSAAVPGNFFGGLPIAAGNLARPASGWVNGSGKITFNHNPAAGLNYTIVSKRQGIWDHWTYGLQYPSSFGETIVVPPTATTSSYTGHMDIQPNTLLLGMQTPNAPHYGFTEQANALDVIANPGTDYTTIGNNLNFVTGLSSTLYHGLASAQSVEAQPTTTLQPQGFGITVYGLRPGTAHEFYINGINKRSRTVAPGQTQGNALITDQYGILRFNYYFEGNSFDQDIANQFVSPQSRQQTWATEAAGSIVQPLAQGALTVAVSAPGSSASFQLSLVVDAELKLQTVNPTAVITSMFERAFGGSDTAFTGSPGAERYLS